MKHFLLTNTVFSLSCFGLSAFVVWVMCRVNIAAAPVHRSSHFQPTPTAGGIGPVIAFLFLFLGAHLIGVSKFSHLTYQHGYFFSSVIILAVVGLIDDSYGTSYRFRLLIQVLCAGLLVSSSHVIQWPLLGADLSYAQKLFSVFTIVSLVNATNFIDGLDGLLAGSTLICLIFAFLIVGPKTPLQVLPYSLLFFSVLGFFIFNFPKAKIFMGDTGSTFIGFILAYIALQAQTIYAGDSSLALIHKGFVYTLTPMMFLWFDVGFTLLRRIFMKNIRLTQAHRDHMIHILHDAGYGHVQISCIYFLTVVGMGLLTVLFHNVFITFIQGVLIYCSAQLLFCLWVFSKKPKLPETN